MKAESREAYGSKAQPDSQKTTKKSLIKDTKAKRGETEGQRKARMSKAKSTTGQPVFKAVTARRRC